MKNVTSFDNSSETGLRLAQCKDFHWVHEKWARKSSYVGYAVFVLFMV